MILAALSGEEVRSRLRQGTLLVPHGPLLVRIAARDRQFADIFHQLYGGSEVIPPGSAVPDIVAQMRPGRRGTFEWVIDGRASGDPFTADLAFAHFEWAMHAGMSSSLAPSTSIHAAVVARPTGASVALVGRSGSGKSTLAAGLVTAGWRLVADEFLVIQLDGQIAPVPGVITLKGESIDLIRRRNVDGVFAPGTRDSRRGEISHFATPRIVRTGAGIHIAAIVFPYFSADEPPGSVPIARGEAILRLAEQSHNFHLIGPDGFRALAAVSRAPATAIRFTNLDDGIAAVETVMSTLGW